MKIFAKIHWVISVVTAVTLTIGCSEPSVSNDEDLVGDIIGDPILGISEESDIPAGADVNDSREGSVESNSTLANETIIEEGFVLKGKPSPKDQNITNEPIVSNLPPLDEGSEYSPLAFRDMMNFEYLVEWEKDGQEFDFSAYAQRVPKRLRDKSGEKIAIEGFMIPTIVDENNEVKEFLLLPDQMSCCFGQAPEANGWVVVSATKGVEVMMDRIIRVTGDFTVEERWDEEFFVGLYHMTCNEITGPAL